MQLVNFFELLYNLAHGQLKKEFSKPKLRYIATLSRHLAEIQQIAIKERALEEALNGS